MKIPQRETSQLRELLISSSGPAAYPPRPVLEAVVTLIGDDVPVAGMGERSETDLDPGRWKCVVLTATHLVYVEAARDGDARYELGSPNEEPTELIAICWRRDAIARVEVSGRGSEREFGTEWQWRSSLAVVMADGHEVLLPPHGGLPHYSYVNAVDRFAAELHK